MKPKVRYKIGNFIVQPLEVQHNCQNFAFIIEHEETGKIVFCTDAVSFPYKIKGINHFFIEANYREDLIINNLCKNETIRSHNEYHMEIGKTIEAIKRNINPELKNIVLIHLSDGQSDEKLFQKMVFEEVGIMPYVAERGLEVEINKEEF